MITSISTPLSHLDRAVLRAVAAGRCEISDDPGVSLVVDGLHCCDQFAGPRLHRAGLIVGTGSQPGPVRLTASGQALLEAG